MKTIQGVKMLSKIEVAQLLETTTYFINKIVREGKIRHTRIGRGTYFSEEALLEYLQGDKNYSKESRRKSSEKE